MVAGSLSDKFGRGLLLVLPIFGQVLEGAALLVNTIWFYELPLEALWLAEAYNFLGGGEIWYLGLYSFASDITRGEERASRLARFDGFEQIAYVIGNALSPMIFKLGGYEAAFASKVILATLSLAITMKVLLSRKMFWKKQEVASEEKDVDHTVYNCWQNLKDILFGMLKTVFKKRPGRLTLCILLQIGAYFMYYISFGSGRFIYKFTRKTLQWTQDEFITLKVARKTLGISILVLLLPLMKRLKFSDVNLLLLFNFLHGLGYFIGSFASYSPWFLYLGCALIPFHYPKYSVARSLLR